MKQAPFTSKHWRRVEYERLVDLGVFEGESLELIGGQLIVAESKGSPHAAAVGMAGDAVRAALPPRLDRTYAEPDCARRRIGAGAGRGRRARPTRRLSTCASRSRGADR